MLLSLAEVENGTRAGLFRRLKREGLETRKERREVEFSVRAFQSLGAVGELG